MKLRELYQEGAVTRTLFTNRILDFFALYSIATPVTTAYKNIQIIQNRFDQREKGLSLNKKENLIDHELAQCAAQIAATLVGSSLLKNIGTTVINIFGTGWFTKELADLGLAIGQAKFMTWINSDEGRHIISKWLTGHAFKSFGIIGESGPLFDKYIGSGLKNELVSAEKSLKSIKPEITSKASQATGLELNKPMQPIQTIQSTPRTDIEYNPNNKENPYRIDVKRQF